MDGETGSVKSKSAAAERLMREAVSSDKSFAWQMHAKIASVAINAGATNFVAHHGAAQIMFALFGVNTMCPEVFEGGPQSMNDGRRMQRHEAMMNAAADPHMVARSDPATQAGPPNDGSTFITVIAIDHLSLRPEWIRVDRVIDGRCVAQLGTQFEASGPRDPQADKFVEYVRSVWGEAASKSVRVDINGAFSSLDVHREKRELQQAWNPNDGKTWPPLKVDDYVEVKLRNDSIMRGRAGDFAWGHLSGDVQDIIAWRKLSVSA